MDRVALESLNLSVPDAAKYPNTFFWYSLLSKFAPDVKDKFPEPAPEAKEAPKKQQSKKEAAPKKEVTKPAKKEATKPEPPKVEAKAKKNDDDFDPFADEMDDEEKAQMERMKAKAAAAGKVAKHVVAKSLIIWEVKPWDEETSLDDLAKKILDIKMDGLEWKTEYKKEPVAYGIFKLVIGAVVEDEKVSTDDVAETIQGFEDYV